MWNIIKEEWKYLTKSKSKIIGLILLLLVPAIYAGIFLCAFKTPMKGINNASIVVVNLDKKSTKSKKLAKDGIGGTQKLKTINDPKTFNMKIKDVSDLYNSKKQIESDVKDNKYDGAFIIPNNFEKQINKIIAKIEIGDISKIGTWPPIKFYTSYKNNYISGEILEMRLGISSLRNKLIKSIIKTYIKPTIRKLVIKYFDSLPNPYKIFHTYTIGDNIKDYGQGMYPFFFSIGLWAGCVMMVFSYKNHRPGKVSQKYGAIKNYFARTLFWVFSGWIQTLLMVSLAFVIGLKIDNHAVYLFAYTLFVSTLFSLIIQAIAFLFRMGEIGSFIVLILLIMQLVAASATFPVNMQNSFFKAIHPLLPFTYTVQSFRSFLEKPTFKEVMSNQWPILCYLSIIPLSIGWNVIISNYRFKHYGHFVSHEKDFGDE